jgi:hypothetical protein
MAYKYSKSRYRNWYAKLLRFYSKPFRERFGEGMEQTFNDLCREREESGEGLFAFALWVFVDTSAAIMRERITMIVIPKKNIVRIALVTALLLMAPLVAMLFTDEVAWDLFDFIVMGSLLFGVGFAYELVARRSEKAVYRGALGVGLAGAFLLFWVNGAVGIIGNEGQPANLMYGAVFAVGFIGSLMARFKPRGMARTLFAAALTQMLVPVIALLIWPPPAISWAPGVFGVFALSAFFAMLFVGSALLFRRASATGSK